MQILLIGTTLAQMGINDFLLGRCGQGGLNSGRSLHYLR